MIKVKLCGFKEKVDVDLAVSLNVDFIGFIFHSSSPRNITPEKAKEISVNIPARIKKVAVVVSAEDKKISEIISHLKPDYLQLHGNETPERTAQIRKIFSIPVIKAFPIGSAQDLLRVKDYEKEADLFLFDSKINSYSGGTGISFNWKILQGLKTTKKWFLAGGLNINNIEKAIEESRAPMIDISSGIEEVRGIKSQKLIKELVNNLKNRLHA